MVRAISILILLLVTLRITVPVFILAQGESTATPDSEGIIYSEVRPNDSLWSVSARAGISLAELLSLNNLTEEAIIQPGQLLIVGQGSPPATATIPATATATLPPPPATNTAVPPPPTAICLKAFDDIDHDGIHDPGESLKAAVAFTIFNEERVISNYITDGLSEPFCLAGLATGNYQITRSIGRDETLSTSGDLAVTLNRGNVVNLAFGSYTGVTSIGAAAEEPLPDELTPIAATAEIMNTLTPELVKSNPSSGAGLSPNRLITGVVIVLSLFIGVFLLLARRH